MVQVVLSASACACPYRKAASTSTHDTRSKVNLQACAGGSEWWEESHHLRGQTALIHCISNVQVITATVHQNKCEVGVTSWQVDLGRYNRAMQHTMVVAMCMWYAHTCLWLLPCAWPGVAMCMSLLLLCACGWGCTHFFQVPKQVKHPLSLVLHWKDEVDLGPVPPLWGRWEAAQFEALLLHRTVDVLWNIYWLLCAIGPQFL